MNDHGDKLKKKSWLNYTIAYASRNRFIHNCSERLLYLFS